MQCEARLPPYRYCRSATLRHPCPSMEVGDVSLVASSGAVLSMSEKAALQSSVPLLKKQYRFGSVKLFGKIKGKSSDYLIAVGEESTGTKKYFFRCVQCRGHTLLHWLNTISMQDSDAVRTEARLRPRSCVC